MWKQESSLYCYIKLQRNISRVQIPSLWMSGLYLPKEDKNDICLKTIERSRVLALAASLGMGWELRYLLEEEPGWMR